MSTTTLPEPIATPDILQHRGSFLERWQLFGEPDTDHDRYTIVLVGDGYTASDAHQDAFGARVAELQQALVSTPPFDDPKAADRLNVHAIRTEVVGPGGIPGGWTQQLQPDAAGRVPEGPQDDGAPPLLDDARTTLFGTHHATDRATMRWDEAMTIVAMNSTGIAYDAVVIVANSWRRGGTQKGEVAAAAHLTFPGVALHEIGHLLGLADEYSGEWQRQRPQFGTRLLRRYPNVDLSRPSRYQAVLAPWRALIRRYQIEAHGRYDWRRTIRLENPDCATVDGRTTVPGIDDDAVGLFEGAAGYRCWAWRSQLNCGMRIAGYGFCVVCQEALLERLAPYGAPDG